MDFDRRKFERTPLKSSILCQKVGLADGRLYSGNALNISTGGMLVEVADSQLRDGELLSVEMTLPPSGGLLDQGGRFSTYARVVRVDGSEPICRSNSSLSHTVAIEFCTSQRLRI